MKKVLCKMGIGTCQEEKTTPASSEAIPVPPKEPSEPKKDSSEEIPEENSSDGPFSI